MHRGLLWTSSRPCIARSRRPPHQVPAPSPVRPARNAEPHGLRRMSSTTSSPSPQRRAFRPARASPRSRHRRHRRGVNRRRGLLWKSCRHCIAPSRSSSSTSRSHRPERARRSTRSQAPSERAVAESAWVTSSTKTDQSRAARLASCRARPRPPRRRNAARLADHRLDAPACALRAHGRAVKFPHRLASRPEYFRDTQLQRSGGAVPGIGRRRVVNPPGPEGSNGSGFNRVPGLRSSASRFPPR